MITLVAHVRLRPENVAAYLAVLVEMTAKVRANEPGAVHYGFAQSVDDANTILVIEVYADEAAFEAHWRTDYIWPSIARTKPLLEGGSLDIKQYVSPGTAPVALGRMG